MSRAISLYTDRVTHSLRLLQEIEEEEPRDPIRQDDEAGKSPPHEDAHDTPSTDPEGGHHIDCRSVGLTCVYPTTPALVTSTSRSTSSSRHTCESISYLLLYSMARLRETSMVV